MYYREREDARPDDAHGFDTQMGGSMNIRTQVDRGWTGIVASLLLVSAAAAFAEGVTQEANPGAATVVVCRVTEVIDPAAAVVVKRAIAEAKKLSAAAIVFRIDTPGGRVDSAVEIATAITGAPCRTIAYIEGMGAISAGALISFSCDDIIMASGSAIGAATPVIPTVEGMQPTGEKEVSFMRAKMRSLAESKGHSPDLAQAMVDKDIELRGFVDAEGKYRVYTVAGTTSPEDTGDDSAAASAPKSPVDEILRTITGAPVASQPKAPETIEAGRPIEREPGTVVYPDGSELIVPPGKLLTLTPGEALKYGLIPVVVDGFDMALAHYDLRGAQMHIVEPNWAEKTFRFLTSPTIAGLLLMIGLGAIYYEIKTGGFGLAGVAGAVALTLLFGSHLVLGLADTIDIVLILAGIVLILVEAFVIPGFGVPGITGILFVLAGTYLALVDFTLPQYSWQYDRLNEVVYTMMVAIVTFALFVIATWKLFPKSPLYGALVLSAAQPSAQGYTAPVQAATAPRVGLRGTATSTLRPAGRARFGDATLQVVTRGAFISEGTGVEIIEVDGTRIVVERTEGVT